MKPSSGRFLVVLITTILFAADVRADFSTRGCARGPGGGAWELPPSSGWKRLGSLDFNNLTASDIIATANFQLHEGNTPGTEVEYQFELDGAFYGLFVRRVPARFPTSQTIRITLQDVPAGVHSLAIRLRNLSATTPVKYTQFWISPLLLDASEIMSGQRLTTDIVVGSTFATMAEVTPTVAAGKMVYLTAYLEAVAGTPNQNLEYRILRNGTELTRFEDSVPDVLRDGMNFAYIDRNAPAGASTYQLQARNVVTSGSTTFRVRQIQAQTLPVVTVLEGSATGVTAVSDRTWRTIAASPWTTPLPQSRGAHGTDGSGFGHFTFHGSFAQEALFKYQLESLFDGWAFEVGTRFVHGTSTGKELEALPSNWEQLGLKADGQFRITLQVRGLCSTGEIMQFSRASFQILVIPDNNPFVTPTTCQKYPNANACCEQWPAECTVYSCAASGELSVVSVPAIDCGPL